MIKFILFIFLCIEFSESAVLDFSLQPQSSTQTIITDWPQDAHDAQHTGYTPVEPVQPWTFKWTFNGPDANGGLGGHFYNGSREGRTVTGDGKIFIPATTYGVYALTLSSGGFLWNFTGATINATPAYDHTNGCLYAGGANGVLYKLDARNGNILGSYNAGNPINRSIIHAGDSIFCVTDNGELHKVNKITMTQTWRYESNAEVGTPAGYSAVRDVIVYATNDLYVHCINNIDGSIKWRVKPTQNPAGFPNEFDGMWPVIAEVHGIVFVRMRLDHGSQIEPGTWPYTTNAQTRNYLINNPAEKNLFALRLDNGSEAFIPAVPYTAVEDNIAQDPTTQHQPYGDIGSMPVIKKFNDGTEVAYIGFRNGQIRPPGGDVPWDCHVGEMVLDSSTISGYTAGDLRFVGMELGGKSYCYISDEQCPYTVCGNTIFHSHWGATESITITDRSPGKGLSIDNTFSFTVNPPIIRAIVACGTKDLATHWSTCGMTSATDGRYWSSPGWWVYWNVVEPPGPKTPVAYTYSGGLLPRYTYVSGKYIVIEGNGGDIFVMQHSGSGQ